MSEISKTKSTQHCAAAPVIASNSIRTNTRKKKSSQANTQVKKRAQANQKPRQGENSTGKVQISNHKI